MDRKSPLPRKAYQKPEISRVDLVEDEVSLASCKADRVTWHTAPNSGHSRCNAITCKNVSAT